AGILFWLLAQALRNLPPQAPTIFDLQLAFSAERFQAVLAAWGEQNVNAYLHSMWLDSLFPLAYALALGSWLAILTQRADHSPTRLTLCLFTAPFLAALLDYVENGLDVLLLAILPNMPPALVFLASLAAALKWALIAISFGMIAISSATRLKKLLANLLPLP
ncbi:MAG: hypothetical protein ACK8QZ_04165, partial [Anaerolineales bacterium]